MSCIRSLIDKYFLPSLYIILKHLDNPRKVSLYSQILYVGLYNTVNIQSYDHEILIYYGLNFKMVAVGV